MKPSPCPVRRVPRTIAGTRICTTVGPAVEPHPGQRRAGAERPRAAARCWLRMEYLRPGVALVARRSCRRSRADMGIAHAPSGAWVAYLVIAVMLAVCALARDVAAGAAMSGAGSYSPPERPASAVQPARRTAEMLGGEPFAHAGAAALRIWGACDGCRGPPGPARWSRPERGLLVADHAALPGPGRAVSLRLRPAARRNRAAADVEQRRVLPGGGNRPAATCTRTKCAGTRKSRRSPRRSAQQTAAATISALPLTRVGHGSGGRGGLRAAAVLRARGDPLRPGLGRHAARSASS